MSEVVIQIGGCTGEEFILFPGCCYKGNQFKVMPKDYPPMLTPEEASISMDTVITDVPRLNEDGSGKIEVTSGDVSVPCVGIWKEKEKKAIFIFTIQEINGQNIGISYEKGRVCLTYPAKREFVYRWPHMQKNEEVYKELHIKSSIEEQEVIPYETVEETCETLSAFYQIFFENRKRMGMEATLPHVLSKEEQVKLHIEKYNQENWYEEGGFYGTALRDSGCSPWETGWVGGGISSYALMKLGGERENERGISTLKHLYRLQGESGFFYSQSDEQGNLVKDKRYEGDKDFEDITSIRNCADALYFTYKHFEVMDHVPEVFLEGARKCADAFVTLWKKHGQVGQFVNGKSGQLLIGGSTAGALAGAALIKSAVYFQEKSYEEAAKELMEYLDEQFLSKGYTTGGPNEILQCPDSESAFALLESAIVLYEETKEEHWLAYAEKVAHLASSWVVPYNYKFPVESEFARVGMKTIGAVFANVQNKHAAPGICTLSGTSLHRLFLYTGNSLYEELYIEITKTVSQYMSTKQRPIYSWSVPKDASLLKDDTIRVPKEELPQGYICERVNMSDWESAQCVGGVFKGSCWCEVSNMLILAEM